MTTCSSCKNMGSVIFTALLNGTKVKFNTQTALIVKTFEQTLQEKFKLLRSMLNVKVKVTHTLADNKIVTLEKI